MKSILLTLLLLLPMVIFSKEKPEPPLKVAVIGLVHTHVHWILGREDRGDIEIVAIVEPNRDLAMQYSKQHGYSMDIVFNTMEEMLAATKPEAVTAFNTIYDHLSVVEFCAPRGIHVMVEKPLAVNWEHAQKMIELAEKHDIQLLTNYETSWYGSTYKAYVLVNEKSRIGDIRRIVFHTGHQGPKEIGVNEEFLEWLIDPYWNGGGALPDFGCYGANISTWMMKGQEPISVSCITQQIKPDIYPEVEDEATIILSYPSAQVIIQASWNWSHSRKDMEIYGKTGYVICENSTHMRLMENRAKGDSSMLAPVLPQKLNDPFTYLREVIRGNHEVEPMGLASIENNRIVMQILEAARISAESGKVVIWEEMFQGN